MQKANVLSHVEVAQAIGNWLLVNGHERVGPNEEAMCTIVPSVEGGQLTVVAQITRRPKPPAPIAPPPEPPAAPPVPDPAPTVPPAAA